MLIAEQAAADGHSIDKIGLVAYAATVESRSGEVMGYLESIKPKFANDIAAQTYDFHDPNDEDGSAELGNLRYMYLVWLVLFDLERETDEIVSAVEATRP